MRTYVLMLSQAFPADHPRAGEPTGFKNKLQAALNGWIDLTFVKSHEKIVHVILHTGFGRTKATQFCKDRIREYILNRVQQIRLK